MILMASRALAAAATGADDYRAVYGELLEQARRAGDPALAGRHVRPALAGYWGSPDLERRRSTCVVGDHRGARRQGRRHQGLAAGRASARSRCARRLPEGVRMYTGDDFNYPELIAATAGQRRAARHLRRDRAGRGGGAARARRGRPATATTRCWRRPSRSRATSSPRPRRTTRRASSSSPTSTATSSTSGWSAGWRAAARVAAPRRAVRARRRGRAAARPRARERAHAARAGAGGGRSEHARLSFNSMTADRWPLAEVIDACAEHGIEWIGPWRHKLAEIGVEEARRRIDAAGLKVSRLCRGGFFARRERRRGQPARGRGGRGARHRRARARLRAAGGPRTSAARARRRSSAASRRCCPHANEHGVRLGIEPLHPMMIGERSAIVTLGEALDIAERIGDPGVGVVIDVYHTFWDPRLDAADRARGGPDLGYHVNDWLRGDLAHAARARDDGRRHHRPAAASAR